jgi:membrane protease subunit HflC
MKKLTKYMFIILILYFLFGSIYTVNENEFAYVTRFSKFLNFEDTAGLKFKAPFLDKVIYIPKYKMLYDIPPSDVLTFDKKTLVVDNYTIWKIVDPLQFMRTVSSISEMEKRIDAASYNTIKNIFGSMIQTEIINSDISSVDVINKKITESVNNQVKNYGVEIVSTEVKKFDLPSENEAAVYTRMISEREQMAASYIADGNLEAKKLTNETDKQVGILISQAKATAEEIKGEGESEYMRIIAQAYSTEDRLDFFTFLRSLEAMKISMKGEKTLFLSKDSYIAKILSGE